MRTAIALLAALVSCAPATTQTGPKSNDVKVPVAQNDQPLPEAADAVSYAALPPNANTFVHVDFRRLRASAVFPVYRQIMKLAGDNPVTELEKACGFDPFEVAVEASYGGTTILGED